MIIDYIGRCSCPLRIRGGAPAQEPSSEHVAHAIPEWNGGNLG